MIRVSVGEAERQFSNFQSIDERWITQAIRKRKTDGRSPCVRVKINHGGLNVTLSSGACDSAGGGGGREPKRKEAHVFELWEKRGLNEQRVEPGELVAFLKQVRKQA